MRTLGNKKGFTLIELLVVIAIIGVLASVVMVALNDARAKARDTQRMSDLNQISKALELYYTDTGSYPGEQACDSSLGNGSDYTCLTGTTPGDNWNPSSAIYTALVPNHIPTLPIDPINNTTYMYRYEPRIPGDDYCLTATLEGGGTFVVNNGDNPLPNC